MMRLVSGLEPLDLVDAHSGPSNVAVDDNQVSQAAPERLVEGVQSFEGRGEAAHVTDSGHWQYMSVR